jgi:hypothetical protein
VKLVLALAATLAFAGSGSAADDAVLTLTIQGRGSVTTSAGTCTSGGVSASCTQSFALGSVISLTAVSGPGTVFSGWGGGCTGKAVCSLTMSVSRSVTAAFASAPPPPALVLKSLGQPVVQAAGSGYLLTIRFSTTRPGTARLRLVASGRSAGTITFSARAGRGRFGPFLVHGSGPYTLTLGFTDLSGRTKAVKWSTCLGSCKRVSPPPPPPPPPAAPPPPPASTPTPQPPPPVTNGPLHLVRGDATVVKKAAGAAVTLHFTTNETVTVVVSVLRNSKLVLKGLRFSFPAGEAKIGPFAINKAGSYSFRLVANDSKGRQATLQWGVKV